MKILMIEDNQSVCEMMGMFFKKEKWDAEFAYDGEAAVEVYEKDHETIDIVLLDLNLPKKDGMQVAADIRRVSPTVPIIMLTARDSEMDEVKGLELGVDDFMRKPFSLAVLQARVRKILRRQEEPALLSSGDITVDLGKGEVRKQGELLALSGTEQRLLLCFLEHPGQLLTKGQLLERIWDCEGSYVDENTLAVAIRRLRVKIEEDPGEPRRIRTVHGQGYLWQA